MVVFGRLCHDVCDRALNARAHQIKSQRVWVQENSKFENLQNKRYSVIESG